MATTSTSVTHPLAGQIAGKHRGCQPSRWLPGTTRPGQTGQVVAARWQRFGLLRSLRVLEWNEHAGALAMEDNPERVAQLIAGFVREPQLTAP